MSSDDSGMILVMASEAQTADRVRSALVADPRFKTIRSCATLPDLVAHLERYRGVAAIVDIDPNPTRQLAELDPVIVRFPDTRFVLLTQRPQPN